MNVFVSPKGFLFVAIYFPPRPGYTISDGSYWNLDCMEVKLNNSTGVRGRCFCCLKNMSWSHRVIWVFSKIMFSCLFIYLESQAFLEYFRRDFCNWIESFSTSFSWFNFPKLSVHQVSCLFTFSLKTTYTSGKKKHLAYQLVKSTNNFDRLTAIYQASRHQPPRLKVETLCYKPCRWRLRRSWSLAAKMWFFVRGENHVYYI